MKRIKANTGKSGSAFGAFSAYATKAVVLAGLLISTSPLAHAQSSTAPRSLDSMRNSSAVLVYDERKTRGEEIDDSAVWRAIASESSVHLDESLARLGRLYPGWTPSPALSGAISRFRLMAAIENAGPSQRLGLIRASGVPVGCGDPTLLWIRQEAEAAISQEASLETLRQTVMRCAAPERLTAIEKAWGPFGPDTVLSLIALPGQKHPDEKIIVDRIMRDRNPDAIRLGSRTLEGTRVVSSTIALPTPRPARVNRASADVIAIVERMGNRSQNTVAKAPSRSAPSETTTARRPSNTQSGGLERAQTLRESGDYAGCVTAADSASGTSPMGADIIAGWCEMDRKNWGAALARFDNARLNKTSREPNAQEVRINAARFAGLAAARAGNKGQISKLASDPQLPLAVSKSIQEEGNRELFIQSLDEQPSKSQAEKALEIVNQKDSDEGLRITAAWKLFEAGRCSEAWYAFRDLMANGKDPDIRKQAELGFRTAARASSDTSGESCIKL